MSVFSLEGKHIVITGASSGIGQQCAISCDMLGANISLIGRNIERLELTNKKLINKAYCYTCDLDMLETIPDLIQNIVDKMGQVDGFVHAAGYEETKPFKLHTPSLFQKHMDVNFFAGFEIARLLSLKKFHKDGLSMVFLASVMSVAAQPGQIAYCASKGAVISGMRALAVELAKKKIRANAISPGQVENTHMTNEMLKEFTEDSLKANKEAHLLGWLDKEDVANACIYLLSEASKRVTGINLIVDSGYSAK
ncbi:MAG: SDR family oxidoreductase [Bacteroidales bacterium]